MRLQRIRFVIGFVALLAIVIVAIGLRNNAQPDPIDEGSPPTPDTDAVFEALERGDMDAVATQQSIGRAYFDAGGGPVSSTRLPADAPDVSAITTAMASADPAVREEAMLALARDNPLEGGEQTAVLVRAGLGDADPRVRRQAAQAAYTTGIHFGVVQEVGSPLVWDWSTDVSTRRALIDRFEDPDSETAMWAVAAVGVIFPAAADIRDALVARYDRADDGRVQEAIVAALGNDAYASEAVFAVLAEARQSSIASLRAAAAIASAQSAVPDARSVLTAMLDGESDVDVREAIAYGLRAIE